ncbi:hypothetical protein HanXRQr2_Chr03g0099741 [Helianthus annuus]|uniref:Uncharacterized protein n=1 Tax=Helianthus annuus TaxID=4232 RepID=A0A9K3JEA5_HELAN|nr:hypothetical protein HanXRQr2_Chr03g0099741 [Helianthus annuus]KAJ0592272.1 hypothetical protein HanHA300_Chr03g0083031 [Helianthus annuus]KAJ0599774.1 hypothetical protein HanIR_Chr03g0108821 [Helianthus annuus]KAJ0607258.1 hypothetical protein HanHA89_Chr03g0094531 [Helianthus annuus]KAJ0767318.1 hypothetical protein HanLR1_Chr03g0087831 [Helianthus annuus]
MSMSKAEAAAALEAAHTKKRAREALDHAVTLMGREKINVSVSVNNNTKGNVNNGVAVGPVVVEGNVVNKVDDSNEVLKALNAVELKDNGVMEVDVDSKDSGIGSVVENGSVKKDDLVKIGESGQEQGPEKVQVVVENNVSNPVN